MSEQQKQNSELELELVLGAIQKNITEMRYNDILDILLPTVADCPEAAGTLELCGDSAWIQRRQQRLATPQQHKISLERSA